MDYSSYDVIVINTSAGKDSQAMMDVVVNAVPVEQRAKIVAVHADLGRVEWKGTRALAEEQAKHYGLRFEVVARTQDLLDQVEQRGKWPSSTARYCTSDHKRDQVAKLFTRFTQELKHLGRPIRILNCMGIRALESDARKKKKPFQFDKRASNGLRHVDTFFPIFDWTVDQVWATIKASGVKHHWAYDKGMDRLSCCFCVMGRPEMLMIAARENPELLDAYVAVEKKIGHTFTAKYSIQSIKVAVEREERLAA